MFDIEATTRIGDQDIACCAIDDPATTRLAREGWASAELIGKKCSISKAALEVYIIRAVLGDRIDDFAALGGINEVESRVIYTQYTIEGVEFTKDFEEAVYTLLLKVSPLIQSSMRGEDLLCKNQIVAKLPPALRSANILKATGRGLSRGNPVVAIRVVLNGLPILSSAIIFLTRWITG